MNVIEIENVTKTFGDHTAVNDLVLSVPPGSIYGFIGPNGSGKTTTIRMIMSILYPDTGSIRVFGEKMHGACSSRIGYLPEERGLYRKMTVRDVLRFYGTLKAGKAINDRVDFWLEKLELADWADNKVEALSKGMSQKVQFISTVVADPELVILDEPFTGLDPVNLDIIRQAILELRKNGTTVIFSTHDMNVAETMCDYIFMIYRGCKVLDGRLGDIKDSYGKDTVRIGCDGNGEALNRIDGIDRIRDLGQVQELYLLPEADPHQIIATIMSRTKVDRFEIARPSLHDIFVRIANPQDEEQDNA